MNEAIIGAKGNVVQVAADGRITGRVTFALLSLHYTGLIPAIVPSVSASAGAE